ncbi:MAG: cupin-like domain-containing protein [Beijerinckiaceae bacterium]|nr:cupin-like domain-containing protein [Beijerinckiaceae bacterium]
MNQTVFTSFEPKHVDLFNNAPLRLDHSLDRSALFSMDALAELIERYPREHYSLVHMGEQGSPRKTWREGDIGGLTGRQVIDWIANGRMWLNLRNVKTVDPRYQELLDAIFGEMAERLPGFSAFNQGLGILISSPKAQVYYHCDLPGQSLWQIAGRKRVFLYPNTKPFLTPEQLEGIALFSLETDMRYEPWFDEHAVVHDLEPGQMLHWPLNAPHRVENYDCLNVSMTIEYWTDEIRRAHMVNVANGILRQRFGWAPKSRAIHGPGFAAKAVLQKALKNSAWLKREKAARRPVDFKLDRERRGHIVDLATQG